MSNTVKFSQKDFNRGVNDVMKMRLIVKAVKESASVFKGAERQSVKPNTKGSTIVVRKEK